MYTQSITRLHRTALVIAIDCSGSMVEELIFNSRKISKADAVAEVTNRLLFELIERARRSDGVRNYYDIAVVGYSGEGVYHMLGNGDNFISIDKLADLEVETQTLTSEYKLPNGDITLRKSKIPCWVKPSAQGKTPMFEALLYIRKLLLGWVSKSCNVDSFPPIVFNITDGEASDGDDKELLSMCEQIKSLKTADGNVLLINIQIASSETNQSVVFPTFDEANYTNRYAELLYNCSSEMPEVMNSAIMEMKNCDSTPPFRGVSYNASIVELLTMLNIGSISVQIE